MRTARVIIAILLVAAWPAAAQSSDARSQPVLTFQGTEFSHRFSQNEQHEFTPDGQEDLTSWTAMLTIIYLPHVGDGEGLAAVANNVYSMYQNSGVILDSDSAPRTESAEAQHFIAAALTGDGLVEVAMARLVIVDEIGVILVFSHRFYGDDSNQAMEAWLANYRDSSQDALMEFTDIPARNQFSN